MSTPKRANRQKRSSSLYRYLAVVVLVCIALPALISGSMLIYTNYERTVNHESRTTAEGYADVLEAGMSVPLWNVSPDLGRPIVENVFVDPSVQSVVVYTESASKFLEYARTNDQSSNEPVVTVSRDVRYGGEVIGSFQLGYSLDKARTQASKEAKTLAIIICVQLIVSLAAISLMLHRRVLLPLKKLDSAAAGIAQGDLRTQIPYLNDDEFGSLSERLERMRSVLEENFTELEGRVETRTAQLLTVNETLQGALNQLRQAQDSLVQSEKLAALGSLVAGVAHELNTPIGNGLTVISSLCDACDEFNRSIETGLTRGALDKFRKDMDEGSRLVCRNLEKASELVSSFKQVAVDRTNVQRRKYKLRAFLEETLLTASPVYKHTPFSVELVMDADTLMDGYPGPLGQVVTNLLNNAIIHAFGGRDHGAVRVVVRELEDHVELVVSDDGVGIAYENQPKIFNPFFTTKMGEGGNGLGMNIVHNIVTGMMGGQITLHSTPGEGTTFTIVLPISAPEDAQVELNSLEMQKINKLAC